MSAVVKRVYGKDLGLIDLSKRKWSGIKNTVRDIKKYLKTHPVSRWFLMITLVTAVIMTAWGIVTTYNRFAQLQTRSDAFRAELGTELKRRHNLIPNMIAVVREYTVHESESFKYISDAREKFIMAKSFSEKLKVTQGMEKALSNLFALFEQYPDLKATQSAQDLIKELVQTENRIILAKTEYNENTRLYNQATSTFPGKLLWRIYGYPKSMAYMGIGDESLKLPEVQITRQAVGKK